jgi:hypothetical protein
MKPIDRSEVMGLADYETVREHFRARIIGEKKRRRVPLGPKATVLFENRDTVLLQIQEMLRTERITRDGAIMHEIETYNESVPGEDELSCTVMIEIVDKAERDDFLRDALGFEQNVWLVVDGARVRARAVARAGEPADRTTAIHYLKFKLPADVAAFLRSAQGHGAKASVEVSHPAYYVHAALPQETVLELISDLRP